MTVVDTLQSCEVEPNDSPQTASPVELGNGLNGCLQLAKDDDCFSFELKKNQRVRFQSKARSAYSPALLKIELLNSKAEIISASAVANDDECSVEQLIPEDGQYVLRVVDILGRGGSEYVYHVSSRLAPESSVKFKPDLKTRDRWFVQPGVGAFAIDLQLIPNASETEISIAALDAEDGFSSKEMFEVINPVIPAKAKDARVYIRCTDKWTSNALGALRLNSASRGKPETQNQVSSSELWVKRQPHVPYPQPWKDGMVVVAGSGAADRWFVVNAPDKPLVVASGSDSANLDLVIKRETDAFKEAITLIDSQLPSGWTATPKIEADKVTLAFKLPKELKVADGPIVLTWYAESNDRAQVTTTQIQWAVEAKQ